MADSSVTNNRASLAAALPNSVDMLAIAGGVHISDRASASIHSTAIAGNSASMTNSVGDAIAFSGGLHGDVPLRLSDDTVSDNTVAVATLAGSSGNASGDSGAGEISGNLANMRFIGNSVIVTSAAGSANAAAGATILGGSLTNSSFDGNRVIARSSHGSATVRGGGLQSDGALTLRNTTVNANTGDARGHNGSARGGGIFAAALPNGPPAGPLHLVNSAVTRNAARGSFGFTIQGGGIFVTDPVTLTHSVIAHNTPDQCSGC